MKKRKNFIFNLGNNVDVDHNMNILIEENHDPDIWLGMLEHDVITEEFIKRKKLDIENNKSKKNNDNKTSPNNITYTISKLAVPTIATIVFCSLGLLPGIDATDSLNIFNWMKHSNNISITANLDENESMDIVFNCRVIDGTQTLEINDLAVTRVDNNPKVVPNTIAPGTSGEFIIEMDATRNRSTIMV